MSIKKFKGNGQTAENTLDKGF